MTRLLLAVVAFLGFAAVAQAGQIVVPAEDRYMAFHTDLPACGDSGILSVVTSYFQQKESQYWNSPLEIGSYDRVREIGFRSNGLGLIPRRFCLARAHMNDNRNRLVVYQIQADTGFAGFFTGVEWCVLGLDRDFAYAPACSALRPFVQRFLGERAIVRALY